MQCLRLAAVLCVLSVIYACGGGSPAAPSPPKPSTSATMTSFTACPSYIYQNGVYVLATDMPACDLSIIASNISLDCQQHKLDSLNIANETNVSVVNCVLGPVGQQGETFVANQTTNSSLKNSVVVGGLETYKTNGFVIDGNRVSGDSIISSNGDHALRVTNNTITETQPSSSAGGRSAVIYVTGGDSNLISGNTMDGNYHGNNPGQGGDDPNGTDDGIVLANTTNDQVQNNTISNVFDAGVEGSDDVSGSTISGNTIVAAHYAGIGSYHCTNWQNNVVSSNRVSQAEFLLMFYHSVDSQCSSPGADATQGAFINNQFTNNTLSQPTGDWGIYIDFTWLNPVPVSQLSGNVVQGNNMGSNSMLLLPLAGFINGGANTCSPGGNVTCGG